MKDYIKFGILWVILSAIAEWIAYIVGNHFYYTTGAVQAVDGQNAAAFILYVITPIFVFVVLMLLFGIFQFKRKTNEDASPHQFRTNKAFIGIWVGLSLIINLFLFVHPTASAMEDYFNQAAAYNRSSNELIVDVTGRQWEWQFSYPQYGITQSVDPTTGNDLLVLPVDRPVKFVIRSYDFFHPYDSQVDVIHSFWIPAFGMKVDAVPGETRYMYIQPTKTATTAQNAMYRVQCAEVCGPGHPLMYADMAVVSASGFQSFIAQQKKLQ